MGIVFKNNAKTTLASSLSNSATSATVTDGSVFPSLSAGEFFLLTFDDGTNNEICKCTARSGNTLTIVRAQESTTARAFSSGDAAEGRVTAGVLETIQENIAAKSANQTVYNTTTASSATDYDIGIDPSVEANAMVFLNGVMQHHDTFSFSGSTLTFDAAPPNGMALEVIVDNLINLQSSNLTVDTFTATSGQTDFVLSDTPAAETNLIVFVDGVFQDQDSYTISNNTLTITDGVVLNRGVTVYVINPVNIGTPSDGTVTSAKLSGNITMPGTLTVGSNDVAFDSPTFVVDNANSRVGLGTASPSVPVDIVGDVKMSANLTVDTSTLVVDSTNNRVGIGTSSPQTDLNIVNSSGATLDINTNTGGADSKILLHEGTSASPANGASIRYDGANNLFKIGVGSNVDTSRLTIERDTGNVGIGNDNPEAAVHIGSSGLLGSYTTTRTTLAVAGPNGSELILRGQSPRLWFDATNSGNGQIYMDGAELQIYSGNPVSAGSQRLTIDGSGNVGIATSNPNANLHIGSASATGDATNPALQIGGTSTYRLGMYTDSEAAYIHNANGDNGIRFHVKTLGEVARMVGGNGALGVRGAPPSDANSSYPLISVGASTFMQGLNESNESFFGNNSYWASDNSWHRSSVGKPAQIAFADGETFFRASSSAGSGSNITWAESMRITNSGDVGIGTTSPSALLHLNNSGNTQLRLTTTQDSNTPTAQIAYSAGSGYFLRLGDAANNEDVMIRTYGDTVFNGGNVLIGTTTSEGTLTVEGDATAGQFTALALKQYAVSNDQGSSMTCDMDFYLWDNNTTISTPQARIGVTGDATADQNYEAGGQLCFYTNIRSNTSPSLTERMRINSSGQVGINCTDQSNLLTVDANSASSGTDSISVRNRGVSSVNNTTGLRFQFNSAVPSAIRSRLTNTSNGAGTLSFYTSSDGSAANLTERYSIDTVGRLISGSSSFAHNTYGHAAVFTKNSVPNGVVVIEDSDVSSGIGNTVLNLYLRDQDPASYAVFCEFRDGGGRVGSITHNDDGGGVTYNTTSDYRLKENVNYTWDALPLINQLKPAKFNFIGKTDKTRQGFLAHEVSDIVPGSVKGDKDQMEPIGTIRDNSGNIVDEGVYEHFCKEGQTWTQTGTEPIYQQLDYARLVPLLTKAIQEQQAQIETLKQEIREIREGG